MNEHISVLIGYFQPSVSDQLQSPPNRQIPFRSSGSNNIYFGKMIFLHDFFPDIGNILLCRHQNTVINNPGFLHRMQGIPDQWLSF